MVSHVGDADIVWYKLKLGVKTMLLASPHSTTLVFGIFLMDLGYLQLYSISIYFF